MESKVNQYIAEHGPSAVEQYVALIEDKRSLLSQLRTDVSTLEERYKYTLKSFRKEDIIDIVKEETKFGKLSRMIQIYTSEADKLTTDVDDGIDINPNFEITYFYNSGKFIPPKNSVELENEIDDFLKKLITYRKNNFSNLKDEDLVIAVQSVGYTDGEPVSSPLEKMIGPLCQGRGYSQFRDYNYCLGFLRANKVMDIVEQKLDGMSFNPIVDSKGAELAEASTQKDRTLRKCILSYAIYLSLINI